MAAPKRPTHIVTHRSLYLRVEGKLQEMTAGTQLTLSPGQAKKLEKRGMVQSLKEAKSVDFEGSDNSNKN